MTLLKTILTNIIYHLIVIHKGSIIAKFKSVFVLSFYSSIPTMAVDLTFGIVDVFSIWIQENGGYLFFVLLAIGIDHILGSYVHAFIKRDFSIRKNIVGILTKIFIVISAGMLFEGFQFIYREENVITEYLTLITRLMVFLYPAGSALMNCSIVTNGKLPPIGWFKITERFNKDLDINHLTNNKKQNEKNEFYNDDEPLV